MKSKFLFFILFLLVVTPIVTAQPSFTTIQFDKGFRLEFPEFGTIKQNTPQDFNFHIKNTSNGVIITNSTASCLFHLFDNDGKHVINNQEIPFDVNGIDFQITIDAGNFTRLGEYCILANCNSSSQGGNLMGCFEVTFNGKGFKIQEALIQLGLVAFITLLFLLSLYGAFALEFKNQRNNEGNIFKINWKKYPKIVLAFLSYFIFIWVLNILIELSNNYVASSIFFTFLKFLYIFLIGMMLPIFVITLVITITLLFRDIEIKKLLSGGFKVK